MLKKRITFAISLILLTILSAFPAHAERLPNFGSCLNPQGKVLASYETGKHGIVGRKDLVTGSDSVYQSSDKGVTQCFCPLDGNGIQTNWFDVSKLKSADIETLKKEGWTYFATGSDWGLKDVPYLAKNTDYACKKTAQKKGDVQKVLSLASTGDSLTIYIFILSGATFLISGMVLRKVSK
ncbi:MAG TPA: hypothetical protein VM077_05905 [Candidatus Limnocylindrales bacterium]|nr:hypothetical protein [Candidatus Limnocylindrales bacterium]